MERIKNYLVELTKTDNAIAAVWDESKLKNCWEYIRKQAQKLAKNGCAMVEDAQVYKWARDFYLGDIETENATEVREEKPVVKENLTTEEKNYTEVKAKTENGVEYTQIVQNEQSKIQESASDDGIISYPIFDGEEEPAEVEEEISEETPKTEKLHITAVEQEEPTKEKEYTTMADIEAMKKPKTKKSKEEKEAEKKMIDAMQPSLFDDLF